MTVTTLSYPAAWLPVVLCLTIMGCSVEGASVQTGGEALPGAAERAPVGEPAAALPGSSGSEAAPDRIPSSTVAGAESAGQTAGGQSTVDTVSPWTVVPDQTDGQAATGSGDQITAATATATPAEGVEPECPTGYHWVPDESGA